MSCCSSSRSNGGTRLGVLYFGFVNLPDNAHIPNLEVDETKTFHNFLRGYYGISLIFPQWFDYEVKGNNVFISGIDWNKEYVLKKLSVATV